MVSIAAKPNLNRESLYRMLSKKGNPEIESLYIFFHTMELMELKLAVETKSS
jgi:DNA-binding phage protein